MDYWEDRVVKNGKADAYEAAIKKFRKNKRKPGAGDILYDELVACGIYAEEASEMVRLERQ